VRSAYEACLESLTAGKLPAAIPTTVNGEPTVFAVAHTLRKGSSLTSHAYSPSTGQRLAAAVVAIAEARGLAIERGHSLTS
jgi:hypothetical protein